MSYKSSLISCRNIKFQPWACNFTHYECIQVQHTLYSQSKIRFFTYIISSVVRRISPSSVKSTFNSEREYPFTYTKTGCRTDGFHSHKIIYPFVEVTRSSCIHFIEIIVHEILIDSRDISVSGQPVSYTSQSLESYIITSCYIPSVYVVRIYVQSWFYIEVHIMAYTSVQYHTSMHSPCQIHLVISWFHTVYTCTHHSFHIELSQRSPSGYIVLYPEQIVCFQTYFPYLEVLSSRQCKSY